MKKKGILLALLVLVLTMTVAVATAECAHTSTHYEHDQTTHWQVCDDCGEIMDDPWEHRNDCSNPGVCRDCGATGVTIAYAYHGNTHWEYDQTTHWQVCDDCGEIPNDPFRHIDSCTIPGVCAYCGATDVTIGETYHGNTHWEYDQTTHWGVCDDCGAIAWDPLGHYGSCTTPGVCEDCGATGVTMGYTSHGNTHYEHDQTTHWEVCDECGEIAYNDPSEHYSYCNNPDVCEGCGATGVTIAYTDHPWDSLEWHITDTTHEAVCTLCGEIAIESETHSAWCGEPGVCGSCDATGVTIAYTYHSYANWRYDQTTHWEVCSNCGEITGGPWVHAEYCNNRTGVCRHCGAAGVTMGVIDHQNTHYEHDQITCWEVCDDCGETIDGPYEHYEACYDPGVCLACGSTGVTMDFTQHYYSSTTQFEFDEKTHWFNCVRCGLFCQTPHYTNEGDPAGICSLCGAAYTAEPVKLNGVTVSGNKTVGSTLTATISATGATAYSFWVYDANNTLIQDAYMTASNTFTFTLPRPGGYAVLVAVTDGLTTASGSSEWFLVTGDQVAISGISISGTQEVGSAITATVSATGATYYSYWVYNGQGELVSEAYMTTSSSYSFTPAKPGIYNVFVAVSDGLTTAQENSGWFPVKGDPVVINALTVSGDKKPGSPLTATINATGATAYSYWVYDANNTLLEEAYMVSENSFTFTPAAPGGYNIFVAVTDGVSSAQTNSGWFLVE